MYFYGVNKIDTKILRLGPGKKLSIKVGLLKDVDSFTLELE